jgi:two-component system response regulator RegX3
MKILIVEDEPSLCTGLVELLEGADHEVQAVGDGLAAINAGLDASFELVVLDLMLPKLDGVSVCRQLRKARPLLPILMLTAKASEDDKVRGLQTGADDYVTKPFGARELLARIDALSRRAKAPPPGPELLEIDGCRFDLGHGEARRGGEVVLLTARETGILRWLYQHRARAVARSEFLEKVWGARPDMDTRTVDMTVANLRHKIERDPGNPQIVVSIKGIGYAWGARE